MAKVTKRVSGTRKNASARPANKAGRKVQIALSGSSAKKSEAGASSRSKPFQKEFAEDENLDAENRFVAAEDDADVE